MKFRFLPIMLVALVSVSALANEFENPQIKYSKKQFELKIPQNKVHFLDLEIRDSNDKVVYATTYKDVKNFEKIYSVEQLPKGKYFVKVVADGKVYRDMIRVKKG